MGGRISHASQIFSHLLCHLFLCFCVDVLQLCHLAEQREHIGIVLTVGPRQLLSHNCMVKKKKEEGKEEEEGEEKGEEEEGEEREEKEEGSGETKNT